MYANPCLLRARLYVDFVNVALKAEEMAIYHLSAQVISRSQGRSSIAAAAYRAGEKYLDKRIDRFFDYENKEVDHSEIMLPFGAPIWMEDREKLWNAVEAKENRKDSQLAREIQVALPLELSKDGQLEALRNFVAQNYVSQGMVADVTIHRDQDHNPHAHIMLTMREVTPEGFGQKERTWNAKHQLLGWRMEWSRYVNKQLRLEGFDITIDHRSYADQGIKLEPTSKIGGDPETDNRDVIKYRYEEHLKTINKNVKAIQKSPEIALDAITSQRSTFTRTNVAKWLNTRTVDAEQFTACLESVMASPELVQVGVNEYGNEIYSTQTMLELEKTLLDQALEMKKEKGHRVKLAVIEQAESTRTLSDDQKSALWNAVGSGDMAVVIGRAGTGKSYMLGACREAWEASGYRVHGACLAGKAAEGLQVESGIESRTIASWEYAWKEGRDQLDRKDILVIDEAGMVGTDQLAKVIGHAKEAGAKVILVGDPEQLQPIMAGGPLRAIADELGQITLEDNRRQYKEWQKDITKDLGSGDTIKGLKAYDEAYAIHELETKYEAMIAILDEWNISDDIHPGQKRIILAYRHKDVRMLNEGAREVMKQRGELGHDYKFKTKDGAREFAEGDRVLFLENSRSLGVKNGTTGTLEKVQGHRLQVVLDGDQERRVEFDIRDYNAIDHGYACTIHKSQGLTVDRTYVLADPLMDRQATYVALSRHRDDVDLYYSREDFGDKEKLYNTLSRDRKKELAIKFLEQAKAYEHSLILEEKVKKWKNLEKRVKTFEEGLENERDKRRKIPKEYGKSLRIDREAGPELDRPDQRDALRFKKLVRPDSPGERSLQHTGGEDGPGDGRKLGDIQIDRSPEGSTEGSKKHQKTYQLEDSLVAGSAWGSGGDDAGTMDDAAHPSGLEPGSEERERAWKKLEQRAEQLVRDTERRFNELPEPRDKQIDLDKEKEKKLKKELPEDKEKKPEKELPGGPKIEL